MPTMYYFHPFPPLSYHFPTLDGFRTRWLQAWTFDLDSSRFSSLYLPAMRCWANYWTFKLKFPYLLDVHDYRSCLRALQWGFLDSIRKAFSTVWDYSKMSPDPFQLIPLWPQTMRFRTEGMFFLFVPWKSAEIFHFNKWLLYPCIKLLKSEIRIPTESPSSGSIPQNRILFCFCIF